MSQEILYVLLLEEDKYYVGKTNDIVRRFSEHKLGTERCSEWTKKYKPISIIHLEYLSSSLDEDNKTEELMLEKGMDNVRGGSYSQMKFSDNIIHSLERKFRHSRGECLNCGEKGHFINNV